jgi:hypothetical protein
LQSSNFLPGNIKNDVFHNFSDPTLVANIQVKIQNTLTQLATMWTQYAQVFGDAAITFAT